jgi:DNA end-binding protein Ku
VELAKSLIDASTADDFELSRYHDDYESELRNLIESKSKGKKMAPHRAHKEPAVVNLMEALRKSLGQAQKSKKSHLSQRHARRKTG